MIVDSTGKLVKVTNLDVKAGIIFLPKEAVSIGEKAFIEASQGEKIVWGDSVYKIETAAFTGSFFEELTIPSSVVEIEDNAFGPTLYLKEITIKNPDCKFSPKAFAYCVYLRAIRWRDDLYAIRAFNDGEVWEVTARYDTDGTYTYLGRPLFSNEDYQYVNRRGAVVGYGKTLEQAIDIATQRYYEQPKLVEKWENLSLDTRLTADDFRELTGIGFEGIYDWIKENCGIPDQKTTLPVREILNHAQHHGKVSESILRPLIQFIMDCYKRRENKS